MPVVTPCPYANLNRKQLVGVCKSRKTSVKGKKAELVQRLRDIDAADDGGNGNDGPPANDPAPAPGTVQGDALLTNGTAGSANPAANALANSLQGGHPLPAQTEGQQPPEGKFSFSLAALRRAAFALCRGVVVSAWFAVCCRRSVV
jgi:hypothetical protein